MKDINQGVAYLLRKTSMTLTEIRGMDKDGYREMVEEVLFQESTEIYTTALYVGNILAAILNTVPRKTNKTYQASDFLNIKEPRRVGPDGVILNDKEQLELLAKRFGIKLPGREIKDL